jgi:hypothetical protein
MLRRSLQWLAMSVTAQLVLFAAAALAAVAIAFRAGVRFPRVRRPTLRELVIGAQVLGMLVLRHALLGLTPPAELPSFEETQRVSMGYRALSTLVCAPAWRISTMLTAAGLWLTGSATFDAARLCYRLLGDLALLATLLCLRRLKVGWPVTLAIGWLAASTYVIVFASGCAGAMYVGVSLVPIVLAAAASFDPEKPSAPLWAFLTGASCGLLMFEYAAFKHFGLFAFVWVAWVSLRARRARWLGAAFLGLLLVWGVPVLAFIGTSSLSWYLKTDFLEQVYRHRAGRTTTFSPLFLPSLRASLRFFAGLPGGRSVPLGSASDMPMPAVFGKLLLAGLVACLTAPRRAFAFGLALTVVLGVVVNAASTILIEFSRLASAIPVLLVLGGVALQRLCDFWERRGPESAHRLALAAICAGAGALVLANVLQLRRIASDKLLSFEMDTDDYSVCAHVFRRAVSGQRVIASGVKRFDCLDNSNMDWLGQGKSLSVAQAPSPPPPESVEKGALVVLFGPYYGLAPEDVATFEDGARRSGDGGSLLETLNAARRARVVSYCRGCDAPPDERLRPAAP